MPVVDLHTHSTFSDGTASPKEVVFAALKSGVQIYALTDHDTTDGISSAQEICREHRISFSAGVEISTRDHDHLHFVGYNLDVTNAALQAFLTDNRQRRRERIVKIIRQLNQAGVELTEEEVFSRAANTVSRAHVADALKTKGYAASRQDAFRKYLVEGKAGYVKSAGVSALEAIRFIKQAGGIAVIAHPGIVTDVWNFPAWKEAGLDGVEVFYPAHTYSMKQNLLNIARKYDLFASAGSDYHGPKSGRTTTPGMQIPQNHYDKLLRVLFHK
jgi:hypothetical protein